MAMNAPKIIDTNIKTVQVTKVKGGDEWLTSELSTCLAGVDAATVFSLSNVQKFPGVFLSTYDRTRRSRLSKSAMIDPTHTIRIPDEDFVCFDLHLLTRMIFVGSDVTYLDRLAPESDQATLIKRAGRFPGIWKSKHTFKFSSVHDERQIRTDPSLKFTTSTCDIHITVTPKISPPHMPSRCR